MTTQSPNSNKKHQQTSHQKPAEAETSQAPAAAVDDFDNITGVDQKSLSGMQRVNIRIDGFYSPLIERDLGNGTVKKQLMGFQGVVLGIKDRPLKEGERPQQYMVVKLTAPMIAKSEDKEKGLVILKPGQFLWCDIRHDFDGIRRYLPGVDNNGKDRAFMVAYVPKEKRPLKNGRSMWVGEFSAKRLSDAELVDLALKGVGSVAAGYIAEPSQMAQLPASAENSDDIPF